ncbi:MAG: hypothetical protein NVS3B21_18330 [Acidimicrobiales bacterium]
MVPTPQVQWPLLASDGMDDRRSASVAAHPAGSGLPRRRVIVAALQRAPIVDRKAKDIFRASGLTVLSSEHADIPCKVVDLPSEG